MTAVNMISFRHLLKASLGNKASQPVVTVQLGAGPWKKKLVYVLDPYLCIYFCFCME